MKTKIAIIGLGQVGTTILYNLFLTKSNIEFILIDNHMESLIANIIDLNHTLNQNNNIVRLGEYKDIDDCMLIILAVGIKMNSNRTIFLQDSFKVIKDITTNINKTNFNGNIIVISNPNDVITTYIANNYQKEKVIGTGTFLDTNRLKYYLQEKINIDSNNIDINIIGEHGQTQVVLWDTLKINNEINKYILTFHEKEKLEEKVKNIANEIVSLKGYTNFGVVACCNKIVDLIINSSDEIVNVSSYDETYKIAYSYPSKIINKKIKRVKDLKISDELLIKSINKIKKEYQIFTNQEIIGIDLDDTITIIQEDMLKEASKFDKSINGKGIVDNTKYLVGEKYNWSYELKEEFFKKYRIKVIEKAKVRSDAILYLNKLIDLGYKIVIITARSSKYYDDPYLYTKKWLDENNVPYTKLIVNAKSKKEICKEEKVSIFIDDMPSNCLEVVSLNNIKVFIMDNKDNVLKDNRIKRITNFKELYEEIL